MKRNWFYILVSVANEERHGSGIMRDVLELTGGEVTLWPATLYGSLDEMREHGWIEELAEGALRPAESERKRFYRITARGREALKAEVGRVEGVAKLARSRLAEQPR
jgi:DNA-binding PadR family transcriptional regulator